MSISDKDKRLLFQLSANRCAYPGCGRELTFADNGNGAQSAVSEIAHIVAESDQGPRGGYPLPKVERDTYSNLILLCTEHHKIVDDHPDTYPVEMLRRWKIEHEQRMRQATAGISSSLDEHEPSYVRETLYSTLLPVEELPRFIFSALCRFDQSEMENAKKAVVIPSGEMTPFIIREGRFYCFQDLNKTTNPFSGLMSDPSDVTRHHAQDWWINPDKLRWYIDLLNQALHKLTGRKGLGWDKEHKRYYFKPSAPGELREITYKPLNQSKTTRKVVWQPITKKTGLPKTFWFHTAIALKFHRVARFQWCLSIRPEMHITQDGNAPYASEKKGSRITRKGSTPQ